MATHSNANQYQNVEGAQPSIEPLSSPLGRQVIGKYEMGVALASGDFDCRTRLCSHVVTGAPYVVRIYDKAVLAEAHWMWERVRISINVLRTLPKHENIVEMVECFETTSSLYILMQLFESINVTKMFCSSVLADRAGSEAEDGGVTPNVHVSALSQYSSAGPSFNASTTINAPADEFLDSHNTVSSLRRKMPGFTISKIRNIFRQVVRGVQHMHDHHVVHLGIAPDHILVNHRGLVKIGNLVSCCFCSPGVLMNEMKGTRHTVAPEVLSSDPFDPYLADSWSLGVLLYFMLHSGYPHDAANTLEHIMYNHLRPPDASLPRSAKNLLRCLLQPNPALRLRVSEILLHPFFVETDESVLNASRLNVSLKGNGTGPHGVTITSSNPLATGLVTEKINVPAWTLRNYTALETKAACVIQRAYRHYRFREEAMRSAGGLSNQEGGLAHRLSQGQDGLSGGAAQGSPAPAQGSFHELLAKHLKPQALPSTAEKTHEAAHVKAGSSDWMSRHFSAATVDFSLRSLPLPAQSNLWNMVESPVHIELNHPSYQFSDRSTAVPVEGSELKSRFPSISNEPLPPMWSTQQPCPTCQSFPNSQEARLISSKPYSTTRYTYKKEGTFEKV